MFFPPKHQKQPSKFGHNPTRPKVFSRSSFCFVELKQFLIYFFIIFEVAKLYRMILKSPGTWYLILNHSSVYIWAWAYFTEWTLSLAGCFYDQLNRVDETAKLSCWHSFLFSRYIMVAADSWPTRKRDLEIVSALWLSKWLNFGQWNTVKLIVCRKCCQKWHQRHCWNWYPRCTVNRKLN